MRQWACVLAVLAIGGLAAPARAVEAGDPAPDFTLRDLRGRDFTLSGCRQRVVVIDFWTTWCPHCVSALPHTQKLADSEAAHRGDLVVLAVNLHEEKAKVARYLADNGYHLTCLLDDQGTTARAYRIRSIPRFIVVGVDGKIRLSREGYSEDVAQAVDDAVANALAEVHHEQ